MSVFLIGGKVEVKNRVRTLGKKMISTCLYIVADGCHSKEAKLSLVNVIEVRILLISGAIINIFET